MSELATIEPSTKTIQLGNGRGIELSNYEQLEQFAEKVANSKLVPKRYEKDAGSVAVCIQMGLELGLTPMSSLQNIAVINGIPSIYGDAALALCHASGLLESYKEDIVGEGEDRGIKVTVKRRGQEPHESTFTIKDAKTAGLWGKMGPWKQYPRRMMMFRARGFALRDVFPDVLMGFKTFEEARDTASHQGFENAKNVTKEDIPEDPFAKHSEPNEAFDAEENND